MVFAETHYTKPAEYMIPLSGIVIGITLVVITKQKRPLLNIVNLQLCYLMTTQSYLIWCCFVYNMVYNYIVHWLLPITPYSPGAPFTNTV